MKTKQWKKAAALMSAGAMTASIFAAPLAVKADDKVTISFSFDQGVGEATQKMEMPTTKARTKWKYRLSFSRRMQTQFTMIL